MKEFSIILGKPQHGWLPFEIKIGEYSISDEASDLGLNLIDQLVNMLDNLRMKREAECYFYLEPSAYFFKLEPGADALALRLQFTPDFDNSENTDRETLLHTMVNKRECAKALKEALTAFRQYELAEEDWPTPQHWERLERM